VEDQAQHIELPPPPEPGKLKGALADSKNPPLMEEEKQNFHNASFIYDNSICAIRDRIVAALQQSLVATFILFGWSDHNRRGSCIAADKWVNTASFMVLFLGFYINSRTMTVTWPLYKHQALYEGLGGWSPEFEIQWSLTKADLIELGFDMKVKDAITGEPDPDQLGLHINLLEFIATIINLWLLLHLVMTLPEQTTGYIVDLLSDNTSALSWMKVTAPTKDSCFQPLARFASALLLQAPSLLTRTRREKYRS
jgi:hypothetical protein